MEQYTLIATTAFGLEGVTARELSDLGYSDLRVENGRVIFRGGKADIAKTNLWLRTADRILIQTAEFHAVTFEELFQGTKAVAWEDYLPADAEFPVTGRSVRSGLFSVPDCQASVKKAVVERLKTKYHCDWFPETGAKYKIEVALLKDTASLTIDTTGLGLNKRGYRSLAGPAPIKETMAAALILLSYWKDRRLLVDPFCGSGTIPIEAAMIAMRRAPGLKRSFLCETWPDFSPAVFARVREEANDLYRRDFQPDIHGSDLDPKAVDLAILHAKEAGLENRIFFKQMAVADFYSKEPFGFVITNPPYGERLGEVRQVERLYRDLGKIYTRLDNWSLYLITANPDFEKLFGRKADKRRKLYNGRLECQYYQYLSKEKPPREMLEKWR